MSAPAPSATEPTVEALLKQLSQLPTYTIGRSENNAITLTNGRISGQHARLILCTPDCYVLEDLGSRNGSFVDDSRVTRKIVAPQTRIRLADMDFTVSELLNLAKPGPDQPEAPVPEPAPAPSEINARPLDFTGSFAQLESVFEQYPQLRRDCRNREKMIRTGSVILSSVVGIGAVLTTGGTVLPLLHVLSSAGLSVLVPTLCSTLLSTDEKLELIDKEYRERYRYPNPACRDPFGTREWPLLAQQKTCRRCQAIWVD